MCTCNSCGRLGCAAGLDRRDFLAAGGALALGAKMGLFDFASSLFAGETPRRKKAAVRAVFVRPDVEKYWMGWPGAAYDIAARQKQYTEIMENAAKKLDVDLEITPEPMKDDEAVNTLLRGLKASPPDGLIVISQCLHHPGFKSWAKTNRIAADRGSIPTIVFSPMGTSFTENLQKTRDLPGVFCAATQDLDWLAFGMKMIKTIVQMRDSRICIIDNVESVDRKLDVVGTTLHYIPRESWPQEYQKVGISDEVKSIAEYYRKNARNIVEPSGQDIINAAKGYVTAKRIMKRENCDGISVDCLPLVRQRLIPCPPCIAWLRLNDEGSVGACEADWNAAIGMRLVSFLFDRPGFMQDPAPNTVKNTLMAAHCSCPTKLAGFDKPPEPFILRNHSESEMGVSPQVLWRVGQKISVVEFDGPQKLYVGTGTVLGNIDTPPAGGCRTSVEVELDNVGDSRDTKGFHQLLVYGDIEQDLKAYCSLAGIKAEPLA